MLDPLKYRMTLDISSQPVPIINGKTTVCDKVDVTFDFTTGEAVATIVCRVDIVAVAARGQRPMRCT